MPNLEQHERLSKLKTSLPCGAHSSKRKRQATFLRRPRYEKLVFVRGLAGAGVGAGLAQAAQALHEHWRGEQGILAVDQVVEELVVSRRSHIE